MKKLFCLLLIVFLGLFISCTAEQLKNIQHTLAEKAPEILASISGAYGAPYAGLINSFFNVASNTGGQEGGSPQYAGTYSQGYQQEGQYSQNEGTDSQGYQESWQGNENEGYQQQGGEPQQGYYQDPNVPQNQNIGYAGSPQTAAQKLEVAIDVVKEVNESGRYVAAPVKDGDVLTRNDNYKVIYQCNTRCYIYIAQLDSAGKLDPIFPGQQASWGNPANPYTVYSIPQDTNWFYLDENKGVETIYFIVSLTRRPDIEQLFNKVAVSNKTLVQNMPISINSPVAFMRGIGGTRPGGKQNVNFQDGSQGQYSATMFNSIGADLVLTRWFYHQ